MTFVQDASTLQALNATCACVQPSWVALSGTVLSVSTTQEPVAGTGGTKTRSPAEVAVVARLEASVACTVA